MAEEGGQIEHEPVAHGIQVEVRGIDEMLALTKDPFSNHAFVPIQDTNYPDDPLIGRLRSQFGFVEESFIGDLKTEIYFSDKKMDKDGGYFSADKRAQMREHLRKQGFRRLEVHRNKEVYTSFSSHIPGRFIIDYGPPHGEQDEAEYREELDHTILDTDIVDDPGFTGEERRDQEVEYVFGGDGETIKNLPISFRYDPQPYFGDAEFKRRAASYGKIYAGFLKALYATEGIPEPDMNIILEPPVTKDIVD